MKLPSANDVAMRANVMVDFDLRPKSSDFYLRTLSKILAGGSRDGSPTECHPSVVYLYQLDWSNDKADARCAPLLDAELADICLYWLGR